MTICFCANPACHSAGRCLGAAPQPEPYRSVLDNVITEAAQHIAGVLDEYLLAILRSSKRPIEEYYLQQWTEYKDGKFIQCSRLVPTETSAPQE